MSATMTHYRFTVADYERMTSVGILIEDDRLELIDGEIIVMNLVSDWHVGCVNALTDHLFAVGKDAVTISIQNPIRLGAYDEPQPDLAILRGTGRGIANAPDVLLVIEVADSTRGYDRTVKLPRYAAAGIPEAWIVDFGAETVERHTEPHNGYYRFAALAMRGDTLTSTVFPALSIPVDLALGEASE